MDPERWARIEGLFHQALERPAEDRQAFVDRACEGDPELRRRVVALLEADEGTDFLEEPAARVSNAWVGPTGSRTIGAYRVIRPIGAGGMGEVFLGLDEGPDFRRYVAIKVVRAGVDADFLERFARERAILAQLEHPGIARFLGGGTTAEGRPYFVMEYVEGERIDRFADRARLTVRQRIELFRRVCMAVQHAHGHLIVHRDLKPDNILVTRDGTPRLLDFGIAKLLDDDRPDLTRTGLRLATPAYAAPEQLRGEPVGTSADVHALGVLLYELLSGYRAFSPAMASARMGGAQSMTPPPPSRTTGRENAQAATEDASPASIGESRRTTPAALQRALRGDLDNIVLKAMQPEPDQRYLSAAALAEDLERYLAGEPVRARPPSAPYRAAKFVRRNRLATVAAAAFILTLIASTAATLSQNRRIRAQAMQLTAERDRAREVQGFLLESFGSAGGDDSVGDSLTVRQVLDARARQIDSLYGDQPVTRAEMLHVLADGYERLGILDEAGRWAERAVEERRALAPDPNDSDLARSTGLLGWIRHQQGRVEQAESLLRESLAARRIEGDDSAGMARALNDLGGVLTTLGQLEEAEAMEREALAIRRAIHPPSHVSIAVTANNLGNVLALRGNHEEALELARESARILEAALGPLHRRTLFARRNVAVQFAWLGDWEQAAAMGRAIADAYEELGGPMDIDLAWSLEAYGAALGRLGRTREADSVLTRGLGIARDRLGDHPLTANLLVQRSGLYQRAGRRADALDQARQAVAVYDRLYDDDHAELAGALGRVAQLTTDVTEKLAAYRRSAEMLVRIQGDNGPDAVLLTLNWARTLLAAGRAADALPLFESLETRFPAAFGENDPRAPAPWLGKAEAYLALGDPGDAEEALGEARRRLSGAADVAANRQWLERIEAAFPVQGGR